ncbi:MAG: ABC transporter permease [Chloroflexi bacterium]|nr:ABC transporter permease [Chloroflexota bacterium]
MNINTLNRPIEITAPVRSAPRKHKRAQRRDWRWLRRYRGGLVAAGLLTIIVLLVALAPHITPHDPTGGMNLQSRFIPPFWQAGGTLLHPLGTDNLGRDVLARTLYGGQISLGVAFIASSLASLLGITVGVISGYVGGLPDRALMRLTDIWVAFPFLVLALAVIAVVGSSPPILIALMTLSGWVYSARVTRAQTLKLRQTDYVEAAVVLGAPPAQIVWRHIIPGIISVNIVLWTLTFGTLIIVESSLSFIGLGVNPPTPSWGNMLSDSQTYLQDAWWLSVVPGLALMLTVLCVNAVGDALQKLAARHLDA